jgi:hypothetical protein
MDSAPVVEAMRVAERALDVGDVGEKLRALRTVSDAVDGATSMLLAQLDATKAYEVDGAWTVGAWVRNQLRMNAGPASVLVRNATALADLPLFAEAALAGRVGAGHVQAMVFGIKHLGLAVVSDIEAELLTVAELREPAALFAVLRELKDVKHPEDLDHAYLKGMDKEDLTVTALPDGHHVTGFLNPVTGAMFATVLAAVSAPTGTEDDRTGSQRRVQGFHDLLADVLAGGMPTDKGIRPHLSVFADAETVAAAAEHVRHTTEHPLAPAPPMPDVKPAHLAGHGPVGPHLLMHLLCLSDVTAFLVKNGGDLRQDQVLNVGRTHRLATFKQRRAVLARQHGVCATPGCRHTHLEIHHTIWYSRGGPTDLDLLVGLCSRCHHLLHAGKLVITGDAVTGYQFTTATGRALRRRRTHHIPAA